MIQPYVINTCFSKRDSHRKLIIIYMDKHIILYSVLNVSFIYLFKIKYIRIVHLLIEEKVQQIRPCKARPRENSFGTSR